MCKVALFERQKTYVSTTNSCNSIGEIAPRELRGGLVTLNQLAITVGILLAYIVDASFAPSGNWRWIFGFGLLPALALGLGMTMLPESPRWLLLHQHKEAAMKVLSRIRLTNRVTEITTEVNDILKDAEHRLPQVL